MFDIPDSHTTVDTAGDEFIELGEQMDSSDDIGMSFEHVAFSLFP